MSLPEIVQVRRSDGTPREYMLMLLPADLGFEVAGKVAALLSGPLGSVLGSAMGLHVDGEVGDAELPPEALSRAVTELGKSFCDPALLEVVRVMMTHTRRMSVDSADGRKTHVEFAWTTEFAGEYGALLELFLAALRRNFRSFFATGPAAGLRSVGARLAGSIPRAG